MSKVWEALPKDELGNVLLSPGGRVGGEAVDGSVSREMFDTLFPGVANMETPVPDEVLSILAIDPYWSENVSRWRTEGRI